MNALSARMPILKFLATAGIFQYGFTAYADQNRQSILTIQDYLKVTIRSKDTFSLVGMIKPKSIKLSGSTLNKTFTLTDNINDLRCTFEGLIGTQFKQGQTAVINGYCPDVNQKTKIVVKEYLTKHSMETREWQTKNNLSKNNYGLESFK